MIEIGSKYRLEKIVTEELTAQRIDSGALRVFGTPFMIAMMETAAAAYLQQFLSNEQSSVGVLVHVQHSSPTPVGMRVWAEAVVTRISENGKMIDFAVSAWDEKGPIGSGTHTRAIINNERFLSKCYAKLEQ